MPLTSDVPRSAAFFDKPIVLFDTCAFVWFSESQDRMAELDAVLSTYLVLVPTPVLYELAFGTKEQAGPVQYQMWERMNNATNCIESLEYSFIQRRGQLPPSGVVIVNPGFNEWWTARQRLLTHIESVKAKASKAKKEYSLDALIHATARNCFAPVCTVNLPDFEMLNKVAALQHHDGPVPLFHPEGLIRSLSEEVKYAPPHV